MRRAVVTVAVGLGLIAGAALPPAASAITVSVDSDVARDEQPRIALNDECRVFRGCNDDIRVTTPDGGRTLLLNGPGIQAGTGCAATPTGAACARGPGTGRILLHMELGLGDDRAIVDPAAAEIYGIGRDGNDTIQGDGDISGGYGNDTLISTPTGAPPYVNAGPENDTVTVVGSRGAAVDGGEGADVITGGGAPDALIAADNQPGDIVRCGGDADFASVDAGDTREGCERNVGVDLVARIRFRFQVYRGGYTVPTLLRVRETQFAATMNNTFPKADCVGSGCRGAFFTRVKLRDGARWRFSQGGARVPGRRRLRALRPGAQLRVSYRFAAGVVDFEKLITFTTRRGGQPRRSERCTVEPYPGIVNEVPCVG